MAFCGNCGNKTDEGVRFCPACGTAIVAVPVEQPAQVEQQVQPIQMEQPATVQQSTVFDPPVVPGAPTQTDIRDAQDNKTMAILAYLFFFIPLLTGAHKTSLFAKFHTNQGTILFIAAAAWGIAYSILTFILMFIPVLGWILVIILGIATLIFPVLCIVGIINAVNGTMKPLPVIGKFEVIK